MVEASRSAMDRVRPLLRVRQVREFTDQPVTTDELDAIAEAGRWSGSSSNEQPWRFITIRDVGTLRRFGEAGVPQTRSLRTATAAIAISLPDDPKREVSRAYDDGRASERMLIAALLLGLGAGVAWIRSDVRSALNEILGVPPGRMVRTVVALGHPTEAAGKPKSPPGQARLPHDEVIFDERWPPED